MLSLDYISNMQTILSTHQLFNSNSPFPQQSDRIEPVPSGVSENILDLVGHHLLRLIY